MAEAIGSVRATFTASAEGLVGAVSDSVASLSGLRAAQSATASSAAAASNSMRTANTRTADSVKASAAAMREAAKITREVRTPAEVYAATVVKLNNYLAQGLLTQEVYTRALEKAKQKLEETSAVTEAAVNPLREYESTLAAVEDAGNRVSTVFRNVGDAVKSLADSGSAVIRLGGHVLTATALWRGFSAAVSATPQASALWGIAFSMSKMLTAIKLSQAALGLFGIEADGAANAATAATLAFGGFKAAQAVGIGKNWINDLVVSLTTILPPALARVGIPVATTTAGINSLGAAATAVVGRIAAMTAGFSAGPIVGYALAAYTAVKVSLLTKDAAFETAAAYLKLGEEAEKAGVTIQDMQIQKSLDAGIARDDILKLGLALSALNVERFTELGNAAKSSEEATGRLQASMSGLGTAVASAFTGLFTGLTTGWASLKNGLADTIGGITSVVQAVADALQPFGQIIGEIAGGVMRLAGVLLSLVGVAGRVVGLVLATLKPIISFKLTVIAAGISTALQYTLGGAFKFLEGVVWGLNKALDAVYNALSKIPFVGKMFATNEGGVPEKKEEKPETKGALAEDAEAMQSVADSVREQEASLSAAINSARKYGEAGFTAAYQYQTGLRELNDQLDRGILNTTSYAQAAAELKQRFDANLQSIKDDIEAEKALQQTIEQQQQTLSKAIDSAAQFGQAGFDAALQYQESLRGLNAQLEAGILNETSYAAAAAKAKEEFDSQVAALRERQKTIESINDQITKSAEAGKGLGAAGDAAREQFRTVADGIRAELEKGLITPEEAKTRMAAAADAMNAELSRIGDGLKFAEKIRDQFKSAGQKAREEIEAIDANEFLTKEEKERAKAQVREKAASSLPGGAAEDPVSKFREQQKALADAFANGVIGQQEFNERQARIRDELDASVADIREKQERNNGPDRRQNKASEVNTSEGAATLFRILRGDDEPTAKQLAESRKQTRLLERVNEALANDQPVRI